jgi:hypothetical protein
MADNAAITGLIKSVYDTYESGYNKAKVTHFPCVIKKDKYVCGGARRDLVKELDKLGLTIVPVPGDGDCFYHSVNTYLNLIGVKHYDHLNLRQMVADELLGPNMIDYIPVIMGFIDDYNYDNAVQFLKDNEADIRTPGEWNNYLGELPSMILPKLLGYDFRIYSWSIQNKPLYNNNGRQVKQNGALVSVPDYKYLGETQINLPEGRTKGTAYILNDAGHYELLMPTAIYNMDEVQDKLKEIKTARNAFKKVKASTKVSKTIKAKKSSPINNNSISKLLNNINTLNLSPPKSTSTRRSARIAVQAAALAAVAAAKPVTVKPAAAGAGKKNSESPKLTRKQQKLYNGLIRNGVNNASARLMATLQN